MSDDSGAEPAAPTGPDIRTGSDRLGRECRIFSWALVADVPSDLVLQTYEEAHSDAALDRPASNLDRLLIRVGSAHPWLARLADAYAAVFARSGLFRTKLVVLLAMLESAPPHHARFEREATTPLVTWLRLVLSGLAAALTLLLAIVLFTVPHLVGAVFGSKSSDRSAEA